MEEEQMDLPPGFRFHPTDEELIGHYLHNKVTDSNFSAQAIGEADLNKSEPWDLPKKAKMGDEEWYFFFLRDRKYPTGLRTNRATESGYWKATGKDKEIYRGKSLVGMKKTLVFYKGRAPKGEKSNWIMHEYRLEGEFCTQNLQTTAKNEWVICRVFLKNSNGKKIHFPVTVKLGSFGNDSGPSDLEPRTNFLQYVPCFSNPANSYSNHFDNLPDFQGLNSVYIPQSVKKVGNLQNQFIMRDLVENEASMRENLASFSQETGVSVDMKNEISSVMSNIELQTRAFENQEMEYLWDY